MVNLSIQCINGENSRYLKDGRYDGEEGMDNIDDTIELLQNTISFSMPLLLKPIYDMKKADKVVFLRVCKQEQ